MDTIALVEDQIEDGQQLLSRLLERGVPILVAAWAKPTDVDRWELYLATPFLDEKGLYGAYGEVAQARSLNNLGIDSADVHLLGARDPATRDLLELQSRLRPGKTSRFRESRVGMLRPEEVYVYPPTDPVLALLDGFKSRFPSVRVFVVKILAGSEAFPVDGPFSRQLTPLVGKVNAAVFEEKAPETLLLLGPTWPTSDTVADLLFAERPEGWNTMYREDTHSWERVILAESGRPPYQSADFSSLTELKAPDSPAKK